MEAFILLTGTEMASAIQLTVQHSQSPRLVH